VRSWRRRREISVELAAHLETTAFSRGAVSVGPGSTAWRCS